MSHHRAIFARLAIFAAAATIVIGAACRDSLTAPHTTDGIRSSSGINVPGDSGAPETIFLAPLGPRRVPRGELDTTLTPTVTICRLAGDVCSADTLAHFTSDSAAPDPERVRLTDKSYAVTWNLSAIAADTVAAYRLVVTLGDTTVGYTDAKIVPAGYQPPPGDTARFAFLRERRALDVRFQIYMPAVFLTVIAEPGVHGLPLSGTTKYRHGERVAYQFQADSGYTNVLVTVGQQYLPQRGRITMDASLVLIASADEIASVAPGDRWMVSDGRALLRSTNPVRDAQRYLDRIRIAPDTANLSARLARAERVLAESDPAALRSLDAALAGHAFSAGIGLGTEVHAPGPPLDTTGMSTNNVLPGTAAHPTLVPSRSMGLFTRNRYEPLTIAYVNGVLTSPFGALFNASAIARMASGSTWTVAVPYEVRLIYNSTAVTNTDNPSDMCVLELAKHSEGLGINTLPEYLAQCNKGSGSENSLGQAFATLADFAEAGMQLSSILDRSVLNHPADADSLAAITARWMAAGQHVVFVPHSQGNLMVQQGIDILRRDGSFHPATDSTCIGAVSLAAPTSDNWPISSRHLAGIVAAHDAILLLGKNHFPQIQNPMGDSVDADSRRWHGLGVIPAMIGGKRVRSLVHIHELERGYLNQEPVRTAIQTALVHSYKSCALGEIDVTPKRLAITPGSSGAFTVRLLDLNTEPLDGRRTTTWTADAGNDWERGALLFPDGRVQGRYVGGTAAHVATATLVATVGVDVGPTRIPVSVRESLSATWALIPGTWVTPPMKEIPTGLPLHTFDDLSIPSAPWGGDSCIEKRQLSLDLGPVGRPGEVGVGEFSKYCRAAYLAATEPVENAARYEATFFELNHTNRIVTLASRTASVQADVSGPQASLDPIPGPTLLDRVNVTAWDAAGHLLAFGTGCAHGCTGWADLQGAP